MWILSKYLEFPTQYFWTAVDRGYLKLRKVKPCVRDRDHHHMQLQPCCFLFIVKLFVFCFFFTHFCITDYRIQNEVLVSVLSLLTAWNQFSFERR